MTGATGNIYFGLHEFNEMSFLLHLLRPGDLFVDVRANVGSYTILASSVCGARSISVEPDSRAAAALARNVEANRITDRVQIIQAALGSHSGTLRFTVGLDTMNHVAVSDAGETRLVEMRTLDEVLAKQRPVFIKMDVEGFESEVVAGARYALQNESLLGIQLESVPASVESWLTKAGFRQASYNPASRDVEIQSSQGGPTPNVLFVRDIQACRQLTRSAPSRLVFGLAV